MTSAMDQQVLPIEKLKEWEVNKRLRSITEENYDRLKDKLTLKPQFKPLIVTPDEDGNYIVLAGNHRLKAYRDLGVRSPLWVSIVYFKQDEQQLWYAELYDQKLPERFQTKDDAMLDWSMVDNEEVAYYDREGIVNEMAHFNLDWSQYSVSMSSPLSIPDMLKTFGIENITEEDVDVSEDEAPEVSSELAISELGKVYQLGRHRLMCGDATKIEDVERLMSGQKADMVFTDPPYGIDIGNQAMGKGGGIASKNDYGSNDWDKEIPRDAIRNCLTYSDNVIIWGGNYFTDILPPSSCWVVWDKRGDMTSNDFADGEMAWTSFKKPMRVYKQIWNGMIREGEHETKVHPTQKPIGLASFCYKRFGNENDKILDLFGGSGSSLIACEQTNRNCYMMELDPKYIDVIRKRYAKFIGQEDGWQEATPEVQDTLVIEE